MPRAATFHQLLHHVALLVALHREDPLIVAWVTVLPNRLPKGLVEVLESVFENVVDYFKGNPFL